MMNLTLNTLNESILNVTGDQVTNDSCPYFSSQQDFLLKNAKYWIGGVSVCVVSITGIILNLTAICAILLARLSSRNNFNQLIVILFLLDTVYLVSSLLTTLQIRLGVNHRNLILMFPKFTYPVWNISLTLSIFLTVGVAHERYIAIKYPIIHRQRMRSAKYRRTNLLKYVVSVMTFAMIFNITKFLEIEIAWAESPLNDSTSNETYTDCSNCTSSLVGNITNNQNVTSPEMNSSDIITRYEYHIRIFLINTGVIRYFNIKCVE